MLFKATIQLLIETDDEAHACDAIAEALRPMLQEFGGDALVDWKYVSDPAEHDGAGFEYVPKKTALPK
jgi:hypothetical protein